MAVFYLLALGLSAGQWLPSLEYLRLSVRAHVDYAYVSGGFLAIDAWQLVLPGLYSFFSALYVGVAGLGLAVAAIVWAIPRRSSPAEEARQPLSGRAAVAFFALLALFGLLVSYGGNGFLYPLAYRWLPGWNLFQAQERAAYLAAFGLSVLAGMGLAGLDSLSARARRWLGVLYAAGVTLAVALYAWLWLLTGRTDATWTQFGLAAALTLGLALAFGVILWPRTWTRRRALLLTALIVADLFFVNLGDTTDPLTPAAAVALPPETLALQQAVAEQSGGNLGLPGRAYNEGRVFEDYGMRVGVEDVWGGSPLRLARYAALFGDFTIDRMWQLTGVHHALTAGPSLYEPSEVLGVYPQTGRRHLSASSDRAAPARWVVPTLKVLPDAEARPWLGDARLDLASVGVLPPASDPDGGAWTALRGADFGIDATFFQEGALAAPGVDAISLQRPAPGHLRLDVQSEHGGLLIVSENWMPGWSATQVEGDGTVVQKLPVVRADLAFLGIPIWPGQSTIDLVYRPESVRLGLLISAAHAGARAPVGALALAATELTPDPEWPGVTPPAPRSPPGRVGGPSLPVGFPGITRG